jgi:tryptophan synthase alpha chain
MTFGEVFETIRSEGRAALFPYMMCGIPHASATVGLFEAMAEAGADGFEVGIPYADPLMDGPVIQAAGAAALADGMSLRGGLELTRQIVDATGLPCAVMTYVNPILRLGVDRFAAEAAAAGASAVIAADLPVDESDEIGAALAAAGLGLVQFAAPTTTDVRLDRVVATADPFVYGVAEMGVTGEREASTSHAAELTGRIRERSNVPVVLGVGISRPDQAHSAAGVADGVIVGTALVRRVMDAGDAAAARASVAGLVRDLAAAVRG